MKSDCDMCGRIVSLKTKHDHVDYGMIEVCYNCLKDYALELMPGLCERFEKSEPDVIAKYINLRVKMLLKRSRFLNC